MSSKKKEEPPKIGRKRARSKFEYQIWQGLKDVVPSKSKVMYESDQLSYTLEKNYIPDFTIEQKNGRILYIEAKGLGRAFDSDARTKMLAVKDQHPEKDIRLVFYKDGPVSRNSKTRASDWAVRHGFIFAIGSVPEEWFYE